MEPKPHGLLLVDKPRGVSSHAVVATVLRTLSPGRQPRGAPRYRCGHAGTLDPLATGLLLVLCGSATRLATFLLGHDKTYRATVSFGVSTDTLDADGRPDARAAVTASPEGLASALAGFRGELLQIPPVISALKRDGVPLYKRARRGEEPPASPARAVRIDSLELAGVRWGVPGPAGATLHEADLVVACSAGTYIRALARDLALALGTVGHLSALRRERVGPFEVARALPADMMRDARAVAGAVIPSASALPGAPAVPLTAGEAADLRRGLPPGADLTQRTAAAAAPEASAGLLRLLAPDGSLVAIARMEADDAGTRRLRTPAVFPATPTSD
jgi:tRNA pseudouridine55 synthase